MCGMKMPSLRHLSPGMALLEAKRDGTETARLMRQPDKSVTATVVQDATKKPGHFCYNTGCTHKEFSGGVFRMKYWHVPAEHIEGLIVVSGSGGEIATATSWTGALSASAPMGLGYVQIAAWLRVGDETSASCSRPSAPHAQ